MMVSAALSHPCVGPKPFQASATRHRHAVLCVRSAQASRPEHSISDVVKNSAAALVATATIALNASPAWAASDMQGPSYKKDPLEQRKQLQETVGTGEGASARANYEGDATLDNPNDSLQPKDRSKQQQPLVSSADKQARVSQFEASKAAAGSVDDSQIDPSYAGPGRGSTKGGN